MNTFPNIIIFSVYQGNNPLDDNQNTTKVRLELFNLGIGFKDAEGVFEGNLEESFIVDAKHEKYVVDFCKQYSQKSYLFSHNDRYTELVDVKSGDRQPIGYLESTLQKPIGVDYTYDPSLGLYWITT